MLKEIPKIESRDNQFVKHLVKLRENRNYRHHCASALVLGEQLFQELSLFVAPKLVIIQEGIEITHFNTEATFQTNQSIMRKITNQQSPVEIVAEFPIPHSSSLEGASRILALDRISDPGNLGMLIRSLLAFGWDGLFLLPGCVDLFNEKCISAARGGSFLINRRSGTWSELKEYIDANELTPLVADLNGISFTQIELPKRLILILGHEGQGVSKEGSRFGEKITIPIKRKNMESLNVACAGGILMQYLSCHPTT